jgi:hypothetical protein
MTQSKLAALSDAATQGEWEIDNEHDDEGAYGASPDNGTGYHNYFIGAEVGGKWKTLLDTVNSDHKLINEDYDEDGGRAWDVIGQANAALIVALVNAYRTGKLVYIGGDAVERMARAIMEAKGGCIVKDWQAERRDNPHVELAWTQATAALAALTGETP